MFTEKRVFGVFVVMVGVVLVSFFAYALYSISTSSGKVDHCFINRSHETGLYEIVGHRPWHGIIIIGATVTPDEANELLKNSTVCPH